MPTPPVDISWVVVPLRAREWFEKIRSSVVECARLESDLHDLESQTEPKGQSFGVRGHGSGTDDGSAAILRVVQAKERLEREQASCNLMIEEALAVLYGEDGRGGLAKIKGSTTADCVCGYYLMGMAWDEVAGSCAMPGSKSPADWCRMRARRGLDFLDWCMERNITIV